MDLSSKSEVKRPLDGMFLLPAAVCKMHHVIGEIVLLLDFADPFVVMLLRDSCLLVLSGVHSIVLFGTHLCHGEKKKRQVHRKTIHMCGWLVSAWTNVTSAFIDQQMLCGRDDISFDCYTYAVGHKERLTFV
jgi:hypothetical protein